MSVYTIEFDGKDGKKVIKMDNFFNEYDIEIKSIEYKTDTVESISECRNIIKSVNVSFKICDIHEFSGGFEFRTNKVLSIKELTNLIMKELI
ncbi:hypothetical protein [Paraclostridium bifermentans]|uniref:hypothetical protein n=1 Tax=Paraclostridium bifermentans TaxID=1490 RepID=UPI00290829CE|nr:hypothetical protein [Paraclostridium bifermentans]MDU3337944.1 hypothetical protein [Paraclostridium bifermentans]